ncbi:hypothetical protein N7541_005331 [Penicillium brevicompactum]|uniref:Uncharacterized protein n=1 Tax=Penicillium brevicompactum TaxID=5074 RepID=A0A9W9RDD6_PENBR|nr:hypothetical protein N7541_005331 [Penicillium brevicompactum]
MVTKSKASNSTPQEPLSSLTVVSSTETRLSRSATSTSQELATFQTFNPTTHGPIQPTEGSVPLSVAGLSGTSTSSGPDTTVPSETPPPSSNSYENTSRGDINTTTGKPTSTEGGIAALSTYSSRTVTSVTRVTGITSNSHMSTVGTDHHTTFIPIVGGPLCWFCPPNTDAGFGLFGMGSPGVYPPGPPPPGFPSSLPAITVNSEGQPTYSKSTSDPTPTNEPSSSSISSSSSTSSLSCMITETASSCTVITSYRVDTTGQTTATSTSTSCTPISGCNVMGSTETSLTISTATASCYRFPDDTTSEMRRDVYEDETGPLSPVLRPRGRDDGFNEFGSCDLGIARSELQYPRAPGTAKMVNFMKEQNMPLKGLYIVPEQQCGVGPKVTLISDFDSLTSQAYYDEDKKKYAPLGKDKSPFVQTEHVYELQTMPAFLSYLADQNLISCEDMKKAFFPSQGKSLVQELFNQLPSSTYPDFVLLDNSVNNWKGNIFGGSLAGNGKKPQAKIKEMYNVVLASDYMRIEDVYTKFQTTNARIYEFLRDTFDSCDDQPAPQGGWAPAYSSFMLTYLSSKGAHASTELSKKWIKVNGDTRNGQAETDALSLLTESLVADIFDLDTSTASPSQTSEEPTRGLSTTKGSSTISNSISGSPTSVPATPGSPINSQSSPTQTQAPMEPLGTGKITGSPTLYIAIPTVSSLYVVEPVTNYALLPSGFEVTTLPPATWVSSRCFVGEGDWVKTPGACFCFTWRQTDIVEGSSDNVERVTAFGGDYRPIASCSTTITF